MVLLAPSPATGCVRGRRGITLLEVLISIGVVSVGLLGVAALIPLGSLAVNETAKADRSAALGRSAQHEVRVRRMLERMRDDGAVRWYCAKQYVPMDDGASWRRLFLIGQPFAIDPLFAAEAAVDPQTDGDFNCFPFKDVSVPFAADDPRLPRLRLDIFEGSISMVAADAQKRLPVVNRIFRWQDDLIFDFDEDNPDRRPRQSCLWSNPVAPNTPVVASYPNWSDDADPQTGNALQAQAADNYSWMLTAVPDPSELPNKPDSADQWDALIALRQKTHEVSIVTFYKRDFTCDAAADPPSERFVGIDFIGTGIGGGDAVLYTSFSGTTPEQAQELLKVKENEWIMVTGFVREPRLDPIFELITGPDSGKRRIAKWYRVIRVDDEIDTDTIVHGAHHEPCYQRHITLAGPDWDKDWQYYIGPFYSPPHATIIDGAIGVYTTTVTLE